VIAPENQKKPSLITLIPCLGPAVDTERKRATKAREKRKKLVWSLKEVNSVLMRRYTDPIKDKIHIQGTSQYCSKPFTEKSVSKKVAL